ncbi:MAG: fibronectin type III domain-containing protein, partial [Panacibacter sp.]
TSAQFTTLCNVAPSGLAASAVTNSSATVSWSASTGAVSYDVDYKLTSSGTWTNAATATASTSANLSSLTTGAQYDYRVRANCASGSTSDTSAQFTTLCNVAPSGLAASSVTTSSANISWSAVSGAESYDVDYKEASSGTWTNAATATNFISTDLSGLNYSTQYDWRVRANCASGSSSYTSSQFTTGIPVCNDPINLISSITTTSSTLSWDAVTGASSYDVDYKEAASGTWINGATGTTGTSVNLSGLNYGTIYDWRVRTNCIYGNTSSYSASQFTTDMPACDAPGSLATTGLSAFAATISWNAVSAAASYDVDYKDASSGIWINAATATTSTSISLSGLASATTYDWRVRTNCTYGNTSGYSTGQFRTYLALGCSIPVDLNTTNITDVSATLNWTAVSGAVSYDVGYRVANAVEWTNAASGITATSVNLTGLTAETVYEWRVRTNCSSAPGAFNLMQFTTSYSTSCPGAFDTVSNNSFATAVEIPTGRDIYGTINVSGDQDYYKFVVTATGQKAVITLNNLPANYDLYTYNSVLTPTDSSKKNGMIAELISRKVGKGVNYIKITGRTAATYDPALCYTLNVALTSAAKYTDISNAESKPGIRLYPNPAHTVVNVATGKIPEQSVIKIADVYGRTLIQSNANAISTQVNVSKLTAGTYFVTVISEEGAVIYNTRFIKY